jgi:hypothetical protein
MLLKRPNRMTAHGRDVFVSGQKEGSMLESEFAPAHGRMTGVVDVERRTVGQACFDV